MIKAFEMPDPLSPPSTKVEFEVKKSRGDRIRENARSHIYYEQQNSWRSKTALPRRV